MHVDSPPILRVEPQRTRSLLSPQTSWQQWGSVSHGQSPPIGGRRVPTPAGKRSGLPSARFSGEQKALPSAVFSRPLFWGGTFAVLLYHPDTGAGLSCASTPRHFGRRGRLELPCWEPSLQVENPELGSPALQGSLQTLTIRSHRLFLRRTQ